MKTAEQLKSDFKALLSEAAELKPNEAITLLCTLNGYTEARIEALQDSQDGRRRRKQQPELALGKESEL